MSGYILLVVAVLSAVVMETSGTSSLIDETIANWENVANGGVSAYIPTGSVSTYVIQTIHAFFQTNLPYCWRRTYSRALNFARTCPPDHSDASLDGLCYTQCSNGYTGDLTWCREICPIATSVDTLECVAPATSTCHIPLCRSSCYTCPNGYTFSSLVCLSSLGLASACQRTRNSYSRGSGIEKVCPTGYIQNLHFLCDQICTSPNYVASVDLLLCIAACPQSTYPNTCGPICTTTSPVCAGTIASAVYDICDVAYKVITLVIGIGDLSSTITTILTLAAQRDWLSVAKIIGTLAEQIAEKLINFLIAKFPTIDSAILESSARNASLLMTVTALNSSFITSQMLNSFLHYFKIDSVINAYNKGQCDLADNTWPPST